MKNNRTKIPSAQFSNNRINILILKAHWILVLESYLLILVRKSQKLQTFFHLYWSIIDEYNYKTLKVYTIMTDNTCILWKDSTIELINTSITSHIYPSLIFGENIFLLFLADFKWYNKSLSIIITILCFRFPDLIYLITDSLYLFASLSLFSLPPDPWHLLFYGTCFCKFDLFFLFLDSTHKWYHTIFALLCLAYCT